MNRLFLTAAFLFVLWRVLAPAEPQVPPSLEAEPFASCTK
jgi:hypothetical protein